MIVEQLFWFWHWARHMIKQKLSTIKSQGLHCNTLLSSYKVGGGVLKIQRLDHLLQLLQAAKAEL